MPFSLGQFEQANLSAILFQGENAYGRTVHETVEEIVGKSVAIGSVYTTLDRLEQKGYVKSWFSDPTPERGGRSKRYFKLTAQGKAALRESMAVAGRMLTGLKEVGGVA